MSRRISLTELRASVGEQMRALQSAVGEFDEAVAHRLGINRTDLHCLDVLMQAGGASPGQLADRLGLTTGSVTALVDRLERAGFVTRAPDPNDRRRSVVRPTEEGARRAWQLYGPLAEEGEGVLAGYTADQLRLVIGFLTRSRDVQHRHVDRVRRGTDGSD